MSAPKKLTMDRLNDRVSELEALRERLSSCADCPLVRDATNPVLGEGRADADVVFVGEAPGRAEDLQGRPFVGAAGKILTEALAAIGWNRRDVFITNIVNHRPPGNRDPKPEEIAFYAERFLLPLLAVIQPRLLVTLGRHAMRFFLGEGVIIAEVHGTLRQSSDSRWVVPLYHPAATLYNRALLTVFRADVAQLPKLLECAHNRHCR